MRNIASAFLAGAGVAAFFQWSQIVYRLVLFFGDYHSARGVNHIGDGDFAVIYVANALLLAAAILHCASSGTVAAGEPLLQRLPLPICAVG